MTLARRKMAVDRRGTPRSREHEAARRENESVRAREAEGAGKSRESREPTINSLDAKRDTRRARNEAHGAGERFSPTPLSLSLSRSSFPHARGALPRISKSRNAVIIDDSGRSRHRHRHYRQPSNERERERKRERERETRGGPANIQWRPLRVRGEKNTTSLEDVARARRRRRARSTTLGVARIGNMESAEANAGRRGVSPSLDSTRRQRSDVPSLGRDARRSSEGTRAPVVVVDGGGGGGDA